MEPITMQDYQAERRARQRARQTQQQAAMRQQQEAAHEAQRAAWRAALASQQQMRRAAEQHDAMLRDAAWPPPGSGYSGWAPRAAPPEMTRHGPPTEMAGLGWRHDSGGEVLRTRRADRPQLVDPLRTARSPPPAAAASLTTAEAIAAAAQRGRALDLANAASLSAWHPATAADGGGPSSGADSGATVAATAGSAPERRPSLPPLRHAGSSMDFQLPRSTS